MLVKGYSFKPKAADPGSNVEPFLENDTETLFVQAKQGYLNVGCFCAKRRGDGGLYVLADLNEDSTADDVFGFVLEDSKNKKLVYNGQLASVIRLDSPLVVCPLVVDVDGYRDDVKLIKTSKDHKKYPIGAVILSQNAQTDEYTTLGIDGNIRAIEEEK